MGCPWGEGLESTGRELVMDKERDPHMEHREGKS